MEIRENTALTLNSLESTELPFPEIDGLSHQVNGVVDNILEREELSFVMNVLLVLSTLMSLLDPKILRLLFPLLMLVLLNGCMYSPKFDDYYPESETEITYQEQHQRKQRIGRLLSAENLSKSTAAIITTGINPCQRQRINENFETLIEDITPEGFDEYLSLCEKAKELCGIMNPDRYPPKLLAELVKNYESREYNAGCRQILVFTSRKDVEKTF
jgi:hypothetical protein